MSKKLTREEFITKAREVHGNKYDYSKTEYVDSKTKVCIICPEHGEFLQIPHDHLNGSGCPRCSGKYQYTTEEFIEKACEIHGERYDYSKVEYINSRTKVCIICPEHGEFCQVPSYHLGGCGCPQCGSEKNAENLRMTCEEFIEKAREVHRDKYDYSKVKYNGCRSKVIIKCPIHGEFKQNPYAHLIGQGCPQCGNEKNAENLRMTREEFIERAKEVHGDKYDYSRVKYVNNHTKVCIICPEHGEFWQTPSGHLSGQGCPQCAIEKGANKKRKTTEEFIIKAREIHGDKYDYSKVDYINKKRKVIIKCPIHGEFKQTPDAHLRSCGCPKCGYEKNAENHRMTLEEFIEQAHEIHGDKYDYSKVEYVNCDTKVIIRCPVHGEFEQRPTNHLNLKRGCPYCNESHLEKDVNNFLVDNNIIFERQKHFEDLKNQSYDFYIPNLNTIIECQGIQHFEYVEHFHAQRGFGYEEERDLKKYHFAIEHGYKIIYYTDLEKYDTFLGEPLIKDLDTLKKCFNKI